MIKYSVETDLIYDTAIHKSNQIPNDAIEITAKEKHEHMGNITYEGQQRVKNVHPFEWEDTPIHLEGVRASKLVELSKKCRDSIESGFITDILGYNVHYRSNDNDQIRFYMAAESQSGGLIWEGETLTLHTQAQARLLQKAFKAHYDTVSLHYASLFSQCKNASDHTVIHEIDWGNDDIQSYPSADL